MQTWLTITDVTRMHAGKVCIAGVADDGRVIRPIFARDGISEAWLYQDQTPIIRPFARLMFEYIRPRSQPPHTEDWIINPDFKRYDIPLSDVERRALLIKISFPSVRDIFQADIQSNPGRFLREGQGIRSLGTIKPAKIISSRISDQNGKCDYRLTFTDQTGVEFTLPIVDLTFRYAVDHLRTNGNLSSNLINLFLQAFFERYEVFLRIGVTRPTWVEHPHCCFLQITAIYTFPDYLDDKCFADFSPELLA
jgi:hypothetical protein